MILHDDGICRVCGNRDNVVVLHDHDVNESPRIICKDCLIAVFLQIMNTEYAERLANTGLSLENVEKQITTVIFTAIDDYMDMMGD